MQIFVRSKEGQQPLVVELSAQATVHDLKASIEDKEFIPSAIQRLVYGSEVLSAGLMYELVPDMGEVVLEIAVDGGMRAKWRKKRMRRLRRKRRKMRMRAK